MGVLFAALDYGTFVVLLYKHNCALLLFCVHEGCYLVLGSGRFSAMPPTMTYRSTSLPTICLSKDHLLVEVVSTKALQLGLSVMHDIPKKCIDAART